VVQNVDPCLTDAPNPACMLVGKANVSLLSIHQVYITPQLPSCSTDSGTERVNFLIRLEVRTEFDLRSHMYHLTWHGSILATPRYSIAVKNIQCRTGRNICKEEEVWMWEYGGFIYRHWRVNNGLNHGHQSLCASLNQYYQTVPEKRCSKQLDYNDSEKLKTAVSSAGGPQGRPTHWHCIYCFGAIFWRRRSGHHLRHLLGKLGRECGRHWTWVEGIQDQHSSFCGESEGQAQVMSKGRCK
jgi:hypothetical protein